MTISLPDSPRTPADSGFGDVAPVSSGVEFDIDEFGPRFGAEIRGVDVASASDDEIRAIRSALIAGSRQSPFSAGEE